MWGIEFVYFWLENQQIEAKIEKPIFEKDKILKTVIIIHVQVTVSDKFYENPIKNGHTYHMFKR